MQNNNRTSLRKTFQARELLQPAVLSFLDTLFRRRSDRHIFIAYEFTLIQRDSKVGIFFIYRDH